MKSLTLEQAVKAVIEASEGSVPLNNSWVHDILSKALGEGLGAVEEDNSGFNDDRYQIYKTCAKDLGWNVKTYDQWLNS